jgi:pyrimidine and pyridine-specific 5'-nucleotidase
MAMLANDHTKSDDDRVIVWFDIDNTLYSASTKISHAMGERIHGWYLQCHNEYLLTAF